MKSNPLARLDQDAELRRRLLPLCRLRPGQIWNDPEGRHRVGCIDAASEVQVSALTRGEKARLAIHDPPYNLVTFEERSIAEYVEWCERCVTITAAHLEEDAAFYVWLGADQKNAFQPLPDFILMMRRSREFKPRSFITMRNRSRLHGVSRSSNVS